ncbi:hypothetical protein ABID08_004072 [Rhizobium binae]|uniref:Uncharacterized protein n=1 Tax=Rhizobium binae TaxID=1138190 RepID=A0ABV2MKM2_9HYPH|nr:hypothetical protein [Rhizobium binae]MBX4926696.1 hypothetical protein [Rhizobium binae]MBX4994250.1 hypothetical protein [Rhizobium binae]NKL51529.1 hypothetical protein [Rhizobium leguminosarum bv. viciae]QSY84658.1 hypothetical protein J2J99_24030 [Rhizobium binae]
MSRRQRTILSVRADLPRRPAGSLERAPETTNRKEEAAGDEHKPPVDLRHDNAEAGLRSERGPLFRSLTFMTLPFWRSVVQLIDNSKPIELFETVA